MSHPASGRPAQQEATTGQGKVARRSRSGRPDRRAPASCGPRAGRRSGRVGSPRGRSACGPGPRRGRPGACRSGFRARLRRRPMSSSSAWPLSSCSARMTCSIPGSNTCCKANAAPDTAYVGVPGPVGVGLVFLGLGSGPGTPPVHHDREEPVEDPDRRQERQQSPAPARTTAALPKPCHEAPGSPRPQSRGYWTGKPACTRPCALTFLGSTSDEGLHQTLDMGRFDSMNQFNIINHLS